MAPVHSVLALWPGASAASVQATAQDSVRQAVDSVTGRFVDSVVVHSPLPDPLLPIVQWIFQRPRWVMVGGIILAAVVAVVMDGM